MLKYLTKVRVEYNPLDPRKAACREFLAQCNTRKAMESNPGCEVTVTERADGQPPQIGVTFLNGTEEVFNAASTSAITIRSEILRKGYFVVTEQTFRQAGFSWPILIPPEELNIRARGTRPRIAKEKKE